VEQVIIAVAFFLLIGYTVHRGARKISASMALRDWVLVNLTVEEPRREPPSGLPEDPVGRAQISEPANAREPSGG